MTTCLELRGLSKRFGGLPAVSEVSLAVMPGERRLILGPNGAGKTTLFNLISGELPGDSGSIRLFGREVSRLPAHRRATLGIGRTYQILTLFEQESLLHNVLLALLGMQRLRWDPFHPLSAEQALAGRARAWLARVGLESRAGEPLCLCAYGEKRRLEIALALAQTPRLLLLDEPLAGLSLAERRQVQELLEGIERDVTVVMIEHDMEAALSFAERITVLHEGRVIADGTRADVVSDARTREVYLGQ